MQTTSLTMLEKLRGPRDEDTWTRFVERYMPFIFEKLRRVACPRLRGHVYTKSLV